MSEDKNWQAIFYELFESFFQLIVPGSIAVLLYVQPLADTVLRCPNFMSALIFFILAWILGNILTVLSWTLPKYRPTGFFILTLVAFSVLAAQLAAQYIADTHPQCLAKLPEISLPLQQIGSLLLLIIAIGAYRCYLFLHKGPKLIELQLFDFPFTTLFNLQKGKATDHIPIQRRTHVATAIMFRNLAALSLFSLVWPPSANWPHGSCAILASTMSFLLCLLGWFFMRRQLTENVYNLVRDYAEEIGIPVGKVELGPDGKTLDLSTDKEIASKVKEDLTKALTRFCKKWHLNLEPRITRAGPGTGCLDAPQNEPGLRDR